MELLIETHPFEAFVPPGMQCLILGSFPGKEQTRGPVAEGAWFYGAPRNQFWKIMEIAYKRPLRDRKEKEQLFREARIGITDVIRSCVRINGTNLDENLQVREYNREEIERILKAFHPPVFCTSRFVQKVFRQLFPAELPADLLPSPSPRYFRLSIEDKAKVYKEKLPKLS